MRSFTVYPFRGSSLLVSHYMLMLLHAGGADGHLLQVLHWRGIRVSYNPTSRDPNYHFKVFFVRNLISAPVTKLLTKMQLTTDNQPFPRPVVCHKVTTARYWYYQLYNGTDTTADILIVWWIPLTLPATLPSNNSAWQRRCLTWLITSFTFTIERNYIRISKTNLCMGTMWSHVPENILCLWWCIHPTAVQNTRPALMLHYLNAGNLLEHLSLVMNGNNQGTWQSWSFYRSVIIKQG